jgi:hypothetical protein
MARSREERDARGTRQRSGHQSGSKRPAPSRRRGQEPPGQGGRGQEGGIQEAIGPARPAVAGERLGTRHSALGPPRRRAAELPNPEPS